MARQKNDGKGRMGGRAKGTPNKATTDLKTWVASILDDGREQFIKDLEKLEPIERIKVYTNLLNYVLPKQAPVSNDTSPSEEVTGFTIVVQNKEEAEIVRRICEH